LSKNNTLIGIGFSDDENLVDGDSFFDIIPIYYVQTKNKKNENIFKRYLLEIENCQETGEVSNYGDKCVKDMDLYLTGSWLENSLAYLEITTRKCSNETFLLENDIKTEEDERILENFIKNLNEFHHSDYMGNKEFNKGLDLLKKLKDIEKYRNKTKSICKPKEEIDKKLNLPHYIDMTYTEIDSNPTKSLNSLYQNKKYTYSTIGNGLSRYIKFYYTNYAAQIDYGLIFEDYKVDQNIIGVDYIENDFKLTEKIMMI
jgi:hypothetical protein